MENFDKAVKEAINEIFRTWQHEIDNRYTLADSNRLKFDLAIEQALCQKLGWE